MDNSERKIICDIVGKCSINNGSALCLYLFWVQISFVSSSVFPFYSQIYYLRVILELYKCEIFVNMQQIWNALHAYGSGINKCFRESMLSPYFSVAWCPKWSSVLLLFSWPLSCALHMASRHSWATSKTNTCRKDGKVFKRSRIIMTLKEKWSWTSLRAVCVFVVWDTRDVKNNNCEK